MLNPFRRSEVITNALVEAGNRVIQENKMPSTEDLSLTISNAEAGLNLVMLGIAQDHAKRITMLQGAMNQLEEQLLNPKAMETLSFEERMALLKEVKHSHKLRTDGIQQVRDNVNIEKLHVEMLKSDDQVKRAVGVNDRLESKVIREKLVQTIKKTYTIQPKSPELLNPKLNNVSELAEFETVE